jgi:hypothetical protein
MTATAEENRCRVVGDALRVDVDIPLRELDELAFAVLQNLPEHMMTLVCTKWKYDQKEYAFQDPESGETFEIGEIQISRGLPKAFAHLLNTIGSGWGIDDFMDPCMWDAEMVDVLVQYAIFGEIVYG